MRVLGLIIKKAFKKVDKILFSILLFGLDPRMINAIISNRDKFKDKVTSQSTWDKFQKNISGKRLILIGLDGVCPYFIKKYENTYDIACVYTFNRTENVREYSNVPIKDISTFRKNIYGGNNVYLIASSYHVKEYSDFLKDNGITDYFCYVEMETKKKNVMLRIPIIKFRYVFLYQFFHRDGLATNYIFFPIAAILRKLRMPGFYGEDQKKICALKDRHKGERCFIVATGPSLSVKDVEMLKDEITFSVNGIFKMYKNTSWRPTYYALCDPYVYIDYIKKGYIINLDEFSKEENFFPTRLKKELQKYNAGKKTIQIPFCYLNHLLSDKAVKFHYSDDPVWGYYNMRTVACYCANLAQHMGFTEIYFLGTDCDYITNGQHFSDEKSPNLLEYNQLKKAQELLIDAFSFLKKEMDKRGIAVYNATRGGALEVFPRVELEKVLGIENKDESNAFKYDDIGKMEEDVQQESVEAIDATCPDEPVVVDVSVIMLTYNHERYLRQAIDSILSQETEYSIEILVGDDASTDDTQDIIREYAERYPAIIRPVLHTENVGASRNAWELFKKARGRYIANLEGDDYWTNIHKLQRQISFLEENPDYIGCTHACKWVNQYGKAHMHIKINNGQRSTGDYSLEDLKDGIWQLPGQTGALVYRNIYLNCSEDLKSLILLDRMQCDRSIAMILVALGPIRCMPEVMSNYRYIDTATTSHAARYKRDITRKQSMIRYLQNLEGLTKTLFDEEIFFDKRREMIFRNAVEDCWPNISQNQKIVLNQMIEESGQPEYYRELFSRTLDAMAEQRDKAVITKFKGTIKTVFFFFPRKGKAIIKWTRRKCLSPILDVSNLMLRNVNATNNQIGKVSQKADMLMERIQLLEEKIIKLEANRHMDVDNSENGQ
ncbi:glycosyltransferase [Flavonifractor sp. An306]|uniref:glycosyltransferase n=1 Tax=Flavonifractor sp. An306 TaxID=1965629 RepID=UPI000B38A670|nr:glycosyltransferase [Flavonifractor sp. An306]OUO38217.1 hypothetical protein B5F88_11840 [Flavonifractor sp. An306]